MTGYDGYWSFDGVDIFTNFKAGIESGMDALLRYPPRKPGIVHDWLESNGKDYDLSQFFYDEREITLRFWMIADSKEQFWNYYEGFIALLARPGTRRLQISAFGDRSYDLVYEGCPAYEKTAPIPIAETPFVGNKFTVNFKEPKPNPTKKHVYIITEDKRFIIV